MTVQVERSSMEAAAAYIYAGWNALPIRPRAKNPAVESWTHLQSERIIDWPAEKIDRYLLNGWRDPARGVGIITGAVSGLVVVDCDTDEALNMLLRLAGDWPETPIVVTSAGHHVYYQHPGSDIRNRANLEGVRLDVRGDGGQCVAPPSIHPSGRRYAWLDGYGFEDRPPASVPPDLLALLRPTNEVVPPRPVEAHGTRYAQAALRAEDAEIRAAPNGSRNHTLNVAAFNLARLVASGDLDGRETANVLVGAAVAAGLSEREARSTVASGLRGGLSEAGGG
jgi:bifunctional DNA primase/polymerase-like protein